MRLMPYPYPFGETVTVISRTVTGEDSDGNDVYMAAEASYVQCAVWSSDGNGTGGNEYTDGRDTVIRGLVVLLPPNVTIAATDLVRVGGDVWEVIGETQPYNSALTGWNPGTPIALRRVTG